MRKRPFNILLLSLFFAYPLLAQLPCGFDPLYAQLQENASKHQHLFQKIRQNQRANYRDDEIYILPVVVHVVWNKEEENLSEEIIREQIEVLNNDFRATNEDLTQLRPVFADISGDPRIEFELVKIIRVKTDSVFAVTTDWETRSVRYPEEIKQSIKGGSTAWDPQYYLNVWVAAIEEDLVFGYSYPPPGLANWPQGAEAPAFSYDGIVMNYKAFGANPPPYITQTEEIISLKGRTLVHEIGHYLGLLHPWGNFDLDQNGCQYDDGIDDTPAIAYPSFFDCEMGRNSCLSANADLPDMIENFMDYSNDQCRISFTQQQIQVMREVLKTERKDLRILKEEDRFNEEIIVYPNPSPDRVRVYLRKEIKTDYVFRLRSLDRQILPVAFDQNEAFPGVSFSFDLGHLPNGIYLIELETQQWRFVKKIVLMK